MRSDSHRTQSPATALGDQQQQQQQRQQTRTTTPSRSRKLHEEGVPPHRSELATHNRRLVLSRIMDKVVDKSVKEGRGAADYDQLRSDFESHLAARHRFHEDVEAAKKEEYQREALRRSRFMTSSSSSTSAAAAGASRAAPTSPAASSASVRALRDKQERLRRSESNNNNSGADQIPAHIQRIIDEDNAASGHPAHTSHYSRRGAENGDPTAGNSNIRQQQEGGDGMGTIHQLFSIAPMFLDQDGNPAEPGFGRYTHVVATQGGSTLWTAMDTTAGDGGASSALQLIDGTDGRVLHTIESTSSSSSASSSSAEGGPNSGNSGPCTCLFAVNPSTDSNEVERTGPCFVWAGFADGTVRIFDALIATPVTEGRFHDGAVLAFCASHNGRVFSAGEDGNLIRWNSEATCFEAMSKIVSGHTGMITGLAATRGGKTLFSVSEDGTLREYSVVDGRLRSVRVPPQNPGYVMAMRQQQLQLQNSQQHFDPVTGASMAPPPSASMMSAASLGGSVSSLVFAPLRAVVTTGDIIVSAGDSGEIHLWVSKSPFSAEGPDEETAANGLMMDGQGDDGYYSNNNSVDSRPIGVVPSPNDSGSSGVLSLAVDPVLSHIWAGRADGLAYCYVRHKNTATLSLVNAIVVGRGVPVRCLHAFCCVDTTTTWTVGSDGMNFLWHSSRDRAGTQAGAAMDAMQSVSDKDSRELHKWREALQRLNQLRLRRARKIADLLEYNYKRGVRLVVMATWRRWLLRRVEHRMRLSFSETMSVMSNSDGAYRYFLKWFWWSRMQNQLRLKSAFCRILDEDALVRPRALPLFVAKLQSFVCRLREAELRRNLLVVLRNSGRMGAALRAFRMWAAWAEKRREWIRRDALRHALGRSLQNATLRRYYQKWLLWITKTADRKNKISCMQMLVNSTTRGNRRYFYLKWRDLVLNRRSRAQKLNLLKAMSGDMNRARMLHAFVTWKRYQIVKRRELLERQGGFDKRRIELSPEYQEVQGLLASKRENDEIEQEIIKLRAQQQSLLTQAAFGQRQQRDLELDLALARARADERKRDMAEKMSNIIARMKAKLLNFSSDLPQITNISDKSKTMESRKIFLEAHATVKRIVVDIIKDPHHPTDRPWPLTMQKLTTIPSHAISQLNNAIKIMIVTFDLMPREQRMNLSSDQEIILNGEWLIEMAAIAAKAFIQGPKR